MSRPRIDETLLLGYLLNSLDENEQAAIEEAIAADPAVSQRLEKLRSDFEGLIEANQSGLPEPPGNLASETMRAISDGSRRLELGAPTRWAQFCNRFGMSNAISSSGRVGMFRNALEMSALALCILVFGSILLSNTYMAREHARKHTCAFQMHNLGIALQDYAFHSPRQVVPELELNGPFAFAGIYAIRLNDRRLLGVDDSLLCPNSNQDLGAFTAFSIRSLPTSEQLERADHQTIRRLRTWVGGSYAYSLGVISNGQYHMPRFRSRPHFALLGDSPVLIDGKLNWSNHGYNKCNILYEDGRVASMICGSNVEMMDHPYLNKNGHLNAGTDDDDSALGPGYMGPFDNVEVFEAFLTGQ